MCYSTTINNNYSVQDETSEIEAGDLSDAASEEWSDHGSSSSESESDGDDNVVTHAHAQVPYT